MMAVKSGAKAIYLSGAGVANASYGLPDLGMTSLDNVLTDVRRITAASTLPLLVDIDTGWGSAFNLGRAIKEMISAGAAGVHIEDQVQAKRCGHRPGEQSRVVFCFILNSSISLINGDDVMTYSQYIADMLLVY